MSLDLATLTIEKLIAHEVPVARKGFSAVPVYSEVDCPLIDQDRIHVKERIIATAASSYACDVKVDPESASPVPNLIVDCLSGKNSDFVDVSRQIAQHLYEIQKPPNSDGVLVIAQCQLLGRPAMAVAKVQKDSGMRLGESHVDGHVAITLEQIKGLIFTKAVKVFKAGILVLYGNDPVVLQGVVSDHQRGALTSGDVAHFFLQRFLGCCLTEPPDVSTRNFMVAAESFINDTIADQEKKARYYVALLAEMNSKNKTLSARNFASDHLDTEDRDAFIAHLQSNNVPDRQIDKDTKLIANRIKVVQLEFESGIFIKVPGGVFEDKVRLTDLPDGRTRVELEDRLKNLRGAR